MFPGRGGRGPIDDAVLLNPFSGAGLGSRNLPLLFWGLGGFHFASVTFLKCKPHVGQIRYYLLPALPPTRAHTHTHTRSFGITTHSLNFTWRKKRFL